jgi:hypothetical protein
MNLNSNLNLKVLLNMVAHPKALVVKEQVVLLRTLSLTGNKRHFCYSRYRTV